MIQEIAECIKMCEPVTGRVCSTFCLTFSWSVGELIIGYDVVLIQLTCAHLGKQFDHGKHFLFSMINDYTWKSSHPEGPAEVEVVVGGVGCDVVEDGFGLGGQGHVDRSGSVGPLVQPSQLENIWS